MGLSDAFLTMMWGEIERNNLWGCEAYAVRNALMNFPGF